MVNKLNIVKSVVISEFKRIMNDSRIPSWKYGTSLNCVIDMKAAYCAGIDIVAPKVNRIHGKDQIKTGESTKIYGAQQLLLVTTKKVADIAGMEVERLSNDSSTKFISNDALVLLNGNGRMNFFFTLDDKDKPQYYATFIEPDALGYYNPCKVLEIINTERSMWKTQDMLIKRILEDGKNVNPAWKMICELTKKGYMYQAACEAYTLGSDRITKKKVTEGDADVIFRYFDSAKQIHNALVSKFGEGDDKLLKTKEFPKRVSELWSRLRDKNGEKWATQEFVKFINNFDDGQKQLILTAKNKKNNIRKDDYRKGILDQEFKKFFPNIK